jgi:hypothetical protein
MGIDTKIKFLCRLRTEVSHHSYFAPLPQCKSCRVRTDRSCIIRELRPAPNTFMKSYQLVDVYRVVKRHAVRLLFPVNGIEDKT